MQTEIQRDPLNTPKQAAAQLGNNTGTLANWRASKKMDLPYVKVGKLVRYRQSDIDAFIERNVVGGAK